MARPCFFYAMLLKGLICWAFALPALFLPSLLLEVLFNGVDLETLDPLVLLFINWFGKYCCDFGTTFFLAAALIKDPSARGIAVTQLFGFLYCIKFYPLLQTSLSNVKTIAFGLPIGYLILVLLFLGVSFCSCKNCKPAACGEECKCGTECSETGEKKKTS